MTVLILSLALVGLIFLADKFPRATAIALVIYLLFVTIVCIYHGAMVAAAMFVISSAVLLRLAFDLHRTLLATSRRESAP